jgi:hypothetical protein
LASTVLDTRPMVRWISIVAVLGVSAGQSDAGPSSDSVQLAGEVLVSPVDPWLGGSLHYEHRFEDSAFGVTLRAGAKVGEDPLNDDRGFELLDGLVGLREHWGPWHFEAALGGGAVRREPSVDGAGKPTGGEWTPWPDFQVEIGHQIGPVEIDAYAALLGLGVRIGVHVGG